MLGVYSHLVVIVDWLYASLFFPKPVLEKICCIVVGRKTGINKRFCMSKYYFSDPLPTSPVKRRPSAAQPTLFEFLSCLIYFFALLCAFFASLRLSPLHAQSNTDNAYRKPLKEVLNDIQKRYGVTIRYNDNMVAGKTVTYADWRYRNDVETTLENVLKPLDLIAKERRRQSI